jgi:AAA family ATP:ADP antiporter
MQGKAKDNIIIRFLKGWFGNFTKDELKKFLILGFAFAFIIGVYWSLRPMKDAIFMSMVGAKNIGYAKWLSVIVLLPLVIFYNKMLEKFPRHKMLYAMTTVYLILTIIFGVLLMHPEIGLPNKMVSASRWLGWAWYIYVESFGSLMVALFWAFTLDITPDESGKRGFPLITLIGQLGAIFGPLLILPLAGKSYFNSSAPVVIVCGAMLLIVIALVKLFMTVVPKDQLSGYHGHKKAHTTEAEPGFFEGLQLLFSHYYLIGIFAIISIYEIIVTVIDFHFKNMVEANVFEEASRTLYLREYAIWVNVISAVCLVLGVSNIQRRLGLKFSLMLMPFIIGAAVLTFYFYPVISILFWIMVGAKAFNYALNGPAMKQLYIPTSKDVKYKAQSWIETFGSRGSKATGSGISNLKDPFMRHFGAGAGLALHIALSTYFSMGLLVMWFFIALYLGNTYNKAVKNNEIVC